MLGFLMFSSRWILQFIASKKAKSSVLTVDFWYVSAAGSLLLLLYFWFGQRDIIGILTNLFPLMLAFYNIYLFTRDRQP